MKKKVLIVIVTHNSQKYIDWCLGGFGESTYFDVSIVDSGSQDINYLKQSKFASQHSIVYAENIGFVKGNQRAISDLSKYEYVLFLNPDARIDSVNLTSLIAFADANPGFGIYTVPLIKFDIHNMKAEDIYDSLGIFCSILGRWSDRKFMRKDDMGKIFYHIDAACGALMLVSTEVLIKCVDSFGKIGFESSFYMYKEDIEFSLRAKKFGFQPVIFLKAFAFHCRGWVERKSIKRWAKIESAKNDLYIARRYRSRCIPFSFIKKLIVQLRIY